MKLVATLVTLTSALSRLGFSRWTPDNHAYSGHDVQPSVYVRHDRQRYDYSQNQHYQGHVRRQTRFTPGDSGKASFPVPEAWKENGKYAAHWISEAERAKRIDPDAPMAFLNLYGTCWLVASMQLILALPGIGRLIRYTPQGRFRRAMMRLWLLSERGTAVTSLDELRGTLDGEFQSCTAHSVASTVKHIMEKMQLNEDVWVVDFSIDPALYTQQISYSETLFASRRHEISYYHPRVIVGLLNSAVYTVSRLEIHVANYYGTWKRYRLVAAAQADVSKTALHAVTHVLITSKVNDEAKWYTIDNHYARRINPEGIVYGQTDVVAYELVSD